MSRRLSTTCLPLLALLVTLVLVSHDAVMAAGPHTGGDAHAGQHGDHDPADDTACDELVAARTNDTGPDLDVATVPGAAVTLPALDGFATGDPGVDTGDRIPAPSRAMLQVWLN